MKIKTVRADNRRKCFELTAAGKTYRFPYAKLRLRPSPKDPIATVAVDEELGNEAFTYVLASGKEDTVHVEQVLDYNRDPRLHAESAALQVDADRAGAGGEDRVEQAGVDPPAGHVSRAELYRLLDQRIRRNQSTRCWPCSARWNATWIWLCGAAAPPVPSPSGRGLG